MSCACMSLHVLVQVIGSSGQRMKTPEVEGQSRGLVPGFTGGEEHLVTPSVIAEGHGGERLVIRKGFCYSSLVNKRKRDLIL